MGGLCRIMYKCMGMDVLVRLCVCMCICVCANTCNLGTSLKGFFCALSFELMKHVVLCFEF